MKDKFPKLPKKKPPGPLEEDIISDFLRGNPTLENDCPEPTRVTLTVGTGGFESIQAAINYASSGDVIAVAPGTYREQIIIPAGKDGITIRSMTPKGAIIKPPLNGLNGNLSIITINAKCTRISGFIISGPSSFQGNLKNGIFITNGGNAIIDNDTITDIRDNPLSNLQQGTGINVDEGGVRIVNTFVTSYQLTGIRINGTNSSGSMNHITVSGVGPTNVIVQNGIQFSRGARGFIENSLINDNIFTGQGFVSTGILLFETTGSVISESRILKNDVGIFFASTTGSRVIQSTIEHNKIGIFLSSDSVSNSFDRSLVTSNTLDVDDETEGMKNRYVRVVCRTDNKQGAICHRQQLKKPKSKLKAFNSESRSNNLTFSVD